MSLHPIPQPAPRVAVPWPTLLLLAAVNTVWAGNPVMMKYVLMDFTPLQAAWLRILGAAAMAGAILAATVRMPQPTAASFPWRRTVVLGAVVFCITPLLITAGLDRSLAMHNAFIGGLEPVITILLAWLLLRERLSMVRWGVLGIAAVGFALMSGIAGHWTGLAAAAYLVGNVLLLLGMAGEAVYSLLGGRLVRQAGAAPLLFAALAVGGCMLAAYLAFEGTWPQPAQFTGRSVLGLLWTGPLATGCGYYIWLAVLRRVPVNAAAFTLFLQPLLGAALGYALLGERLAWSDGMGAALILVALGLFAGEAVRGRRRTMNR